MAAPEHPSPPPGPPLISVVILNYNGKRWLDRCLQSLQAQTIFHQIEVIIADNQSKDGSDLLAAQLLQNWPNGRFIQNGGNFGYCEGNNKGAAIAQGKYLLFLNNDTWLEPDCLQILAAEMDRTGAGAGNPQILNYPDHSLQGFGPSGFDLFGFLTGGDAEYGETSDIFVSPGCAYLIRRDLFHQLGRFDAEFFMYADETDLSWRVWISGHRIITVPASKLHHWGAGATAPAEGQQAPTFRTSEFARFHTNRNSLMVFLKSAQHLLLLWVLFQCVGLCLEAFAAFIITRNAAFIKKAYLLAALDCWRLRHHILSERRRISAFRKRSDFWMLRFFRLTPSRWYEVKRILRQGLPVVK